MGKRNKSPDRLGKAARNVSRQGGLPPDVRNLIKGRVVDLSKAHEYYKRLWTAVLPRLWVVVEERRCESYKLDARFFEYFTEFLLKAKKFIRPDGSTENAADLIAWALYCAGMQYGTIPEIPPPRSILVWPENRPFSEAWQSLRKLEAIFTQDVVLEDPGPDCGLQIPTSSDYRFPRICLRVSVSGDQNALPKITMEIEGELVCVLMKGMSYPRDAKDQGTRRNDAKRIWNALLRYLRCVVRIDQPYAGRPREVRLEKAAYLKFFDGLKWRQVAEQLCQKKHTHTKNCRESFRKGVANYFKQLRNHARDLPPVSG